MHFQRLYTIAISLIVLLLVVNQVVIQYWLKQKSMDAYVINISGKQRMLSQKLFALIQYYKNEETSQTIEKEIEISFKEWKNVHNDLLNGNKTKRINIPHHIKLELNEITPNIQFIEEYTSDIKRFKNIDTKKLNENQSVFLQKMDDVVTLLEKNSEDKLQRIIRIEFILALVTLIVIFLEIQYIFRPIISQLNNRNKKLNEQNQVLEEYAYVAAHDLRTPIQNLLNFLGLFKSSVMSRLDDTEQLYFQFVEESANRMNKTTKDLLHYSSANQVELDIFDTKNIFQTVLDDLANVIEDKKAIVELENIPNKSFVDIDLFIILIKNLISNSLKFVSKERRPHILIRSKSDKNYQYFYFQDNGIGIKKEAKDKIFKIFQRLHNYDEYQGTGIGLALCKRIVEAHGGEIWLEDEVFIGSIFAIKIPKKERLLSLK